MSKKKNKGAAKKLRALLRKSRNPKCHYCQQTIYKNAPGDSINKHNSATVDHIYSRNDIRRFLVEERENTVLACHKCNFEKSLKENSWEVEASQYLRENQVILLTLLT